MATIPQIVRVTTADGIILNGFLQPGAKEKIALLHIHGFEGNFYENYFLEVIAKELHKQDIAWLPVNTRGNGKDTDLLTTDHKYRRIGAHFELLEEAYLDIDAWVEFLQQLGYEKIVLMGHSLGTMKAVRYFSEGKHAKSIQKLILLAPFDKKGLLVSEKRPSLENLLTRAQTIVDVGRGDELITEEFDSITLSYKTYVSWYKQDELGRCFEFCTKDYDLPALKKIAIPTKILVGSKDEFFHPTNADNPQEAMDKMLAAFPHAIGTIIAGSVHSFYPNEHILAQEILSFIGEE